MIVKIVLISFLSVLLIFGCTSNNTNQQGNSLGTLKQRDSIRDPSDEAITLEDSIHEIREWFSIVNNNINNYKAITSKISFDSTTIDIIEYVDRYQKHRKKIVYKSTSPTYELSTPKNAGLLTFLTREYYYRNQNLFFVFEILTISQGDSTTKNMENRYYFDQSKMIRWIHGKEDVHKSDSLFGLAESVFKESTGKDLLYSYDYFKKFKHQHKLIKATDNKELHKTFRKLLSYRHPNKDSAKIIFIDWHKNKYLYEVYTQKKNNPELFLYLLEIKKEKPYVEASERLIGKFTNQISSIDHPGDLFYYLMKIQEDNNVEELRRLIPDSGYRTNVVVAIGDSEPQYEHDLIITKDTIRFEHLDFDFSPMIFNYHETIDEEFDTEGEARISYWGGGFSEGVRIKKSGNRIFLMSHGSHDH